MLVSLRYEKELMMATGMGKEGIAQNGEEGNSLAALTSPGSLLRMLALHRQRE